MKTITKNAWIQAKKLVALGLIAASALLAVVCTQAGEMVPYYSRTVGQMAVDPASGNILSIEESGIGTHLGKFSLTGAYDFESGLFLMTATAANGDNVFLVVIGLNEDTVELSVLGGTGRFTNATGLLSATLVLDPTPISIDPLILAYTGIVTGKISTTGSTKK